MSTMLLPADPRAGYRKRKAEIDTAIAAVCEGGPYILGPHVERFEQEFARAMGTRHAVGVASGTDAILLALRALGIKPGDRVATVSNTAVATVSATVLAGARPVLIDVEPDTYTMDVSRLEDALRADRDRSIKAIIPVHLYGHPANMAAVVSLAERFGVRVLEDCAQAHGASIDGTPVGSIGHAAAFSFYPTKNLGAIGDGGGIVTSDDAINDRLRALRQYGWKERYISSSQGYNSRLDEIQAAILSVKLRYLHEDNARRREIAKQYGERLGNATIALPVERSGCTHVYHQYTIRTPRRDLLQAALRAAGIGASVLYPQPIHEQPGYREACDVGPGGLTVTSRLAGEILSVPVYPELRDADVERVSECIVDWATRTA